MSFISLFSFYFQIFLCVCVARALHQKYMHFYTYHKFARFDLSISGEKKNVNINGLKPFTSKTLFTLCSILSAEEKKKKPEFLHENPTKMCTAKFARILHIKDLFARGFTKRWKCWNKKTVTLAQYQRIRGNVTNLWKIDERRVASSCHLKNDY